MKHTVSFPVWFLYPTLLLAWQWLFVRDACCSLVFSRVLCIMIPPMACQWHTVTSLQGQWFLWVLWLPFVTYTNWLLLFIFQNYLLHTRNFFLLCHHHPFYYNNSKTFWESYQTALCHGIQYLLPGPPTTNN